MNEYISREAVVRYLKGYSEKECNSNSPYGMITSSVLNKAERAISELSAADVYPVKCCRMIPFEPDCRGYTDIFICTNCQLHIHLGFIGKNYGGNFCLECGAEVKDGE